jgi:hypothetical protein
VQPFVIQRLASFDCPDVSLLLANAPASARAAVAEFGWEGSVLVLVLERSRGVTLHRWLKSGGGGVDLEVLVAQAVFLLANLERIGVHHNDLHLANIFVERGPPVATVLRFGTQTLRLPPSQLTLRVFDFDMALVKGTTNTLLRRVYTRGWCREMGMCRSRNGRDLAQLMWNMHTAVEAGPSRGCDGGGHPHNKPQGSHHPPLEVVFDGCALWCHLRFSTAARARHMRWV